MYANTVYDVHLDISPGILGYPKPNHHSLCLSSASSRKEVLRDEILPLIAQLKIHCLPKNNLVTH